MRWFKHMTKSWNDEKIAMAVELGGLEAYGLYFRLLEIVAGNMEGDSPPVCEYSVKRFARDCNLLAIKFERLLKVLEKCKLVFVTRFEGLLKVEIPNIVKYRDEYSERQAKEQAKNREFIPTDSRQTPEQDAEAEAEANADTKAESRENQPVDTASPPVSSPPGKSEGKKPRKKAEPDTVDEAYLVSLCNNEAFTGIDVRKEHGKMLAWLKTARGAGKYPTKNRFLNWLNRCSPTSVASGNDNYIDQELLNKFNRNC